MSFYQLVKTAALSSVQTLHKTIYSFYQLMM